MKRKLKIIADGFETEVPEETTVTQLLIIFGEPLRPDMIVEINGRFIHVKDYGNRVLKEGDRIEIIHLDIGG